MTADDDDHGDEDAVDDGNDDDCDTNYSDVQGITLRSLKGGLQKLDIVEIE